MRPVAFRAAILSFAIVVTLATASAQTPPPSGTPNPTDKLAVSKACSQQADAQGLHGKARKKFRSACKKRGGAPQ
jgi:hypothetical protein